MLVQSEDLCHPIRSQGPFTRNGWLFELKHDGFRALARAGRSSVQLLSRSGPIDG
jgi:ATP-dependent DNA ligase